MAQKNKTDVVVSPKSQRQAHDIAAYWTADKMKSALPLPLPILPSAAAQKAKPGGPGQPVRAGSMGPDGGPVLARECFVTSLVNDMTIFPYCAAGKLWMSFGGSNYQGSAWVVGESTICTAGHCVYYHDLGGWATNVLFAGRYNNGSSVGNWAIPDSNLASLRAWTEDKDFAYDLGFGIAASPIRPTTGKLGWIANYPPNQGPYTEIGYPAVPLAGYPFDGQRMWQSVGEYVDGDAIIQACGNMTGGCSGGPWAVYKENDWRSDGVNSHRYGDPNRIYSPYFGDGYLALIEWMKNNGGD